MKGFDKREGQRDEWLKERCLGGDGKGWNLEHNFSFSGLKEWKKRRDLKGKQVCGWMGGAEGAPW